MTKIDMALIPFVRLAPILSESAFPGGLVDYAGIVDAMHESLSAYRVRIVLDDRTLVIGKQRVKLQQKQFAFYALAARARKERWPPSRATRLDPHNYYGWMTLRDLAEPSGPYLSAYYELLASAYRSTSITADDYMDRALEAEKRDYEGFLRSQFTVPLSKLMGPSGALKRLIPNPAVRSRFDVSQDMAADGTNRFGLVLEPHQIEIVDE